MCPVIHPRVPDVLGSSVEFASHSAGETLRSQLQIPEVLVSMIAIKDPLASCGDVPGSTLPGMEPLTALVHRGD